jgi:regulatory protein
MSSESVERALQLAYKHLGPRDRTVAELRGHLEAKGIAESDVAAAVGELREQGYLDDARYAQRFAEDRRLLDGWGRDRIERKLREAGVPPELIAAALADQDLGTELEAAVDLLRRRRQAPLTDDRERERALAFLVRKGYDLDLAYDAVRAIEREGARGA